MQTDVFLLMNGRIKEQEHQRALKEFDFRQNKDFQSEKPTWFSLSITHSVPMVQQLL